LWVICLFYSEYGGNYFLGNFGGLLLQLIGVTSQQKRILFIVTAVRTSNPTKYKVVYNCLSK
jgi:hypothetical protein